MLQDTDSRFSSTLRMDHGRTLMVALDGHHLENKTLWTARGHLVQGIHSVTSAAHQTVIWLHDSGRRLHVQISLCY